LVLKGVWEGEKKEGSFSFLTLNRKERELGRRKRGRRHHSILPPSLSPGRKGEKGGEKKEKERKKRGRRERRDAFSFTPVVDPTVRRKKGGEKKTRGGRGERKKK